MATALTISADSSLHPLGLVVAAWLEKLKLARKHKDENFGKWAKEALQFFDGAHDFMWDDKASGPGGGGANILSQGSNTWKPRFRMTYNRMFEAVALFGPALYFRNPTILCTPLASPEVSPEALGIDTQDPEQVQGYQMAIWQQQQLQAGRSTTASCYQSYLNWLQQVTDKKRQARRAITDALITGAGYLESSLESDETGKLRLPRSMYVSSKDVLKDPDAEYEENVMWMSVTCIEPVNIVEERYGLPAGALRGHLQSYAAESENGQKRRDFKAKGGTHDLIEYTKIYSKNGFGGQLRPQAGVSGSSPQAAAFDTSVFGKNCLIVVAEGVPYPLNLPPHVLEDSDQEAAFYAAQWPTPFWQEINKPLAWPLSELRFFDKPGCIWPVSLFKSVAGEMKFINWCLSFLADKAASACQTIMVMAKEAGAEIQSQLTGGSAPYSKIELSQLMGLKPDDLVRFLQAPEFPQSIWMVVKEIDEKIDKRLGLTELIYGLSSRQMRSAAEANVKGDQISIRPDDMASTVEDWFSLTVMKEAETARFHLGGQDVSLVLGPLGAAAWEYHSQSTDPDAITSEYTFRIEAGSSRKPNKEAKTAQLQEFGQYALPVFQQLAATGQVGPLNAYLAEVAKSMDLDPQMFASEPPPPPEQQPPSPEEQARMAQAQQDMQVQQVKLQMDQQKHVQELQQSDESHQQDMEIAQDTATVKNQLARAAARAKPKGGK